MPDTSFPLARAVRCLTADGVLTYTLAPHGGRLAPVGPGTLTGAFRGADLDSRRIRAGQLFAALPGVRTDGRRFVGDVVARGAVVLAGWPDPSGGTADPNRATPADRGAPDPHADPWCGATAAAGTAVLVCRAVVPALQRLAADWRRRLAPTVVAVTGSNGKTTTKDFLAALLSGAGDVLATAGNWNNELGLPLTLLRLERRHRYAVLELGASAEGEIARLAALAAPRVGVITNAADAHLAAFGSLAGVIRGKGELLDALPEEGVAVLNADSPGFRDWCDRARCDVVSWGREAGEHRWSWEPTGAKTGRLVLDGGLWAVPAPGPHNAANLVAALLAARAAGGEDAALRAGLASFRPSPHRSHVLELGGWTVLDDTYNANPTSVVAAASALLALPGGTAIAVLGVMAELGPESEMLHESTGRRLRELGVDRLVAVGDGAQGLAAGFAAAGGGAASCPDAVAAVRWLEEHATAGARILVKGSRVAGMEEVVTRLESLAPDEPGGAARGE